MPPPWQDIQVLQQLLAKLTSRKDIPYITWEYLASKLSQHENIVRDSSWFIFELNVKHDWGTSHLSVKDSVEIGEQISKDENSVDICLEQLHRAKVVFKWIRTMLEVRIGRTCHSVCFVMLALVFGTYWNVGECVGMENRGLKMAQRS